MNLLRKLLLAAGITLLTIPLARALLIQIDDRSESPFVTVDGTVIEGGSESLLFRDVIAGRFTDVGITRFIVLEPGTTLVSDIIMLEVRRNPFLPETVVFVALVSDDETPLTYTPLPFDKIITETGAFQTIYSDQVGAASLVIQFASDAPEPATLALLGGGVVGLGFALRKRT